MALVKKLRSLAKKLVLILVSFVSLGVIVSCMNDLMGLEYALHKEVRVHDSKIKLHLSYKRFNFVIVPDQKDDRPSIHAHDQSSFIPSSQSEVDRVPAISGEQKVADKDQNATEYLPILQSTDLLGQRIQHYVMKILVSGADPIQSLDQSRNLVFDKLFTRYTQEIEDQARKRSKWLDYLHFHLRFLTFFWLFLVFAPIRNYLKNTRSALSRNQLLSLLPFSLAMCAGSMSLSLWILDLINDLQKLQMTLSVLCIPSNALHLDALLGLKYAPLHLVWNSLKMYQLDSSFFEMSSGYTDPMGTLALIYQNFNSSILIEIAQKTKEFGSLASSFFGPFIALISLSLIYIVYRPIVRELYSFYRSYHKHAHDQERPRLRQVITKIMRLAFIELRAVLLTILVAFMLFVVLFILQLIASGLLGISILSLGIWTSEQMTLNAQLPEYHLLSTLSSIAIFELMFNSSLILILSLGVRGTYLISRDKLTNKVQFKDYAMITVIPKFIFIKAIPKLIFQLMIITMTVALVQVLKPSPTLGVTLMSFAYSIPVIVLWIKLPPTKGLIDLYQMDLRKRRQSS